MTLRETAPKLSPEQYEKNFAEISPRMTPRQAAVEAARCLFCFDAPCTIACPTQIDVPSFIKKITTDNLRGSARVILEPISWDTVAVAFAPPKFSAKAPA